MEEGRIQGRKKKLPNFRFNKGNTKEIISFSFKDKALFGKKAENNSKRSVHTAASSDEIGIWALRWSPALQTQASFLVPSAELCSYTSAVGQ